MISIISQLFGLRKKDKTMSKTEIIQYAENVLLGSGIYAVNSMSDDWPKWEKKMREDLVFFEENANRYANPKLFTLCGKGWELFSIWYRRKNQDKTTPLKKAISMLDEALKIDPEYIEAKIALASILIERPQVRNLKSALNILEKIENHSLEVKSLLSKAKRWTGNLELESDFDYVGLHFIPLTELREERKRCRALVRSLKTQKKTDELKQVLEHMYHIAILHDIATYVMLETEYSLEIKVAKFWDKKLKEIAKNISNYSYSDYGRLVESNNCFFSINDYKTFEMVFGETDKLFDPISLIR